MKITFKNGNILADFNKIENFEGSKNPENQHFKNCCVQSLDHLSNSLHTQNLHFWTSRFLKNSCINAKICYFSNSAIFPISDSMALTFNAHRMISFDN